MIMSIYYDFFFVLFFFRIVSTFSTLKTPTLLLHDGLFGCSTELWQETLTNNLFHLIYSPNPITSPRVLSVNLNCYIYKEVGRLQRRRRMTTGSFHSLSCVYCTDCDHILDTHHHCCRTCITDRAQSLTLWVWVWQEEELVNKTGH